MQYFGRITDEAITRLFVVKYLNRKVLIDSKFYVPLLFTYK